MKKQLLLTLFALFFATIVTSAQSTPVCGGTFTDAAGPNANYANFSNVTTTICPNNPGEYVTVTFTSFALETNFDRLKIYDGTSATAPLIANLTGSVLPSAYTASNSSGCLTFVFTSDGSVNQAGWIANITCAAATTCPKPLSVNLSNITSNSVVIGWLETGNANQWEVIALPCGSVPTATSVGTITTANPYVITGLNSATCYNFFVRSLCSATDVSLWSNITTATTLILCPTPTTLTSNTLTSNSVNFAWTEIGSATSWEYLVLPCTAIAPTATTTGSVTTSNSVSINSLNPLTCYKLYVRSLCNTASTELSAWSVGLSITTTSLPIVNPICGEQFIDNGGANSNYASGSDNTYVICPTIAGEVVNVVFNSFDTETNWDGLYVYDGNSITAPQISSLNPAGSVPGGLAGAYWGTNIPEVFTSTSTNGCLTFRFRSDASVNKPGWVADVICGNFTFCYKPTNVVISNTTYNSATVSWTENNTSSQWEIIVQPSSMLAPTSASTGILTSTNPYLITGLTSSTTYSVFVRSICSASSFSNWSTISTFTTSSCVTPTSITTNSVTDSSAVLAWSAGVSTQWEVLVLTAGSVAPTSTTVGTFVNVNNYTATGLILGTNYQFYVRAICGVGYISNWSVPYAFTPYVALPPLVTNSTTYTNSQLVSNVLVNNPCITISNVTSSTGTNFGTTTNGIGYFTNTNPTFPLTSGIVLSTGSVANVPGPNSSILSDGNSSWLGDTQLESIVLAGTGSAMNSQNATKLEFDFTSLNEFMSFNFLFASDEYGAFQCTYSDAFAFLLTDIETGVTTNLAVVPGTVAPISVVTIRDEAFNTSCSSVNPDFFGTYFTGGLNYSSATNFNGQTVEMTASSVILPNHPYHIKLVVADRSDSAFDSAVFIKAGSFTSGPPQCADKIDLIAFIDLNTNGVQDSGEVNFTYGSFVSQQNNTGDITNVSSPFGSYTVYDSNSSNTYDFSFQINSEYAPYFSASSTNYNDINIALGSGTQTIYFPIVLTNGFNDVTVSIVPLTQPRPGFSYTNKVIYRNLGIATASGTVTFTKDPLTTITSVSQTGIVNNSTGFSYDFTNLNPYETRSFNVTMSVPSIPTVNINNILTNNATISAPSGDINLSNNSFVNSQIVVASYDPNDKSESHGDKIQFNQFAEGDYLYYTINFQNEGTANALTVSVEDILDAKLDETSIRMISASHDYVMERVDNQIIWKFEYINLPPAIANAELSRGYIFFKIKLKPGFAIGDIIPNTASIYFDTNPAIVTNTFNSEFVTTLNNLAFESGSFLLYPNPANGFVQISLQNNSENIKGIKLFDVLGKVVKTLHSFTSNLANINTSDLSKGVYMVEVTSENNLKQVKKLVIK
ncbi:choice-of-anchor L domain-containing protein [Flavobacterium sp.]|uniref:DUF7619 domain-containing protein n=1 Tax=Flavobacterium sp. TaxID=239 RepID=UPI0037538D65